MSERFGEPPTHLDVGSSELHGDIKLVFGNDPCSECPPFNPTEIVNTDKGGRRRLNPRLSLLANNAISQMVEYDEIVGVDITNIDDPVTKHWAEVCSLKPYERLNPENLEEYRKLDHIDPNHERIKYIRADFSSNEDFKKFREQSPVEKYDIITFSTIFYQLSKYERLAMLVNAAHILSDDGLIIIQDASDGDFNKKYNYVTAVIDAYDLDAGPQDVLRWETGRCKRASIELGKLIFAEGKQTLKEALIVSE
jgi:hypothetical protein